MKIHGSLVEVVWICIIRLLSDLLVVLVTYLIEVLSRHLIRFVQELCHQRRTLQLWRLLWLPHFLLEQGWGEVELELG